MIYQLKNYKYLFLICYCLFTLNNASAKSIELAVNQKEINRFIEVIKIIRKNYINELDDGLIISNAIYGIMSKLDPHSIYYNKDEYGDFVEHTTGEYGGIGIEVNFTQDYLKIIKILIDSPAENIGLKEGDVIVTLNGKNTKEMELYDIKNKIRGEVGSKAILEIQRENKKIKFEVERAILKIPNLSSKILSENTAYLKISQFSDQTYNDMVIEINNIKEKMGIDFKSLILDFRDNGGGLLEQAVKISDAFLEKGEIVSIKYKDESNIKRYNASGENLIKNVQIAVLINNYSASASEIVAGALKDNKRAIIIGTKSFGKGSVQSLIPLKDGDAIKLTTALFFTPLGLMIQNNGIIPNIIVESGSLYNNTQNQCIKTDQELEHSLHINEDLMKNKEIEEEMQMKIKDIQLYMAEQILSAGL